MYNALMSSSHCIAFYGLLVFIFEQINDDDDDDGDEATRSCRTDRHNDC